ncbi:UNVERIFIED_CONTAM: hypothetical protein ACS92_01445 [Bacillus cereus]
MRADVQLDDLDQVGQLLEVCFQQRGRTRVNHSRDTRNNFVQERNALDSQRLEDVHDRLDDGRVMGAQGRILEYAQQGLDHHCWEIVLV